MDEGYTILAIEAYGAADHRGLEATLPSGERYQCFLYCVPTALLAEWFGQAPWVYRLPSVLFGLLSIGLVFLVARRLYDGWVGCVAAVLLATSALHIAWSVQVRWYTLFLCLVWLGVWAAVRLWQSHDRRSRLGWGLLLFTSAIAATAVHATGVAIVGALVLWVAWVYKTPRNLVSWWLSWLLLTSVLVGLLVSIKVIPVQTVSSLLSFSYNVPYYIGFLVAYYWPLLPFAFFATYRFVHSAVVLWALFGSIFLPLAFLSEVVHYRYLFVVTPVILILAAVGLWDTYRALRESSLRRWSWLLWVVFGVVYIGSGSGIIVPQSQYRLEQDRTGSLRAQPSYAHTPQPDWNQAYEYILEKRDPGDVVISSQPVFTYLFLREPGYWLAHSYLGRASDGFARDGKGERYVGAVVVRNQEELVTLMRSKSGFVVIDAMARAGRLDEDMLTYIETNSRLVFFNEQNHYSAVWVYYFDPAP
jgi:hypothetical protein